MTIHVVAPGCPGSSRISPAVCRSSLEVRRWVSPMTTMTILPGLRGSGAAGCRRWERSLSSAK